MSAFVIFDVDDPRHGQVARVHAGSAVGKFFLAFHEID